MMIRLNVGFLQCRILNTKNILRQLFPSVWELTFFPGRGLNEDAVRRYLRFNAITVAQVVHYVLSHLK